MKDTIVLITVRESGVSIDHATGIGFEVVRAAMERARDHINERIGKQAKCPFSPQAVQAEEIERLKAERDEVEQAHWERGRIILLNGEEIKRLEAEVKELRRDKERIDELQEALVAHGSVILSDSDGKQLLLDGEETIAEGLTLRDVIDNGRESR